MTKYVLDASVAAKWMLPAAHEPLRMEAFRVLDSYSADEFDLIVPDVFWAECGNILWKAVRQRRLSPVDADLALASILAHQFSTFPATDLLPQAVSIALRHDTAVYDCLYVVLAVENKTQLITADERLANALAAYFPVKWLGAM